MRKSAMNRTHRVIPVASGVPNAVVDPRTSQLGPKQKKPPSNFPVMQSTGFKLNP
jgi:hypothetical protein